MSIQKIKQGYRVRWYDDYNRQKSKSFKRKLDAEVFESQQKILKGKNEIPRTLQTFEVFANYWLQSYGKIHHASSTQVRFSQIVNQYFVPKFSSHELREIHFLHCSELQNFLVSEKKLAPKTVNTVMGLLRKMFHDAVSWNFLEKNPAERVKPLKIQEKEIVFWSFEERDRFLEVCKVLNPKLYMAAMLALHTGLRSGELMGLLRDSLDFERREITVRRILCKTQKRIVEQTKSKRIRRVEMNDLVYRALLVFKNRGPDTRIVNYGLRQLDNMNAYRKICKIANVPVIRWHDLRHTFASQLVMVGVPLRNVQSLLGHSTMAMTEKYAHLSPGANKGITGKLMT